MAKTKDFGDALAKIRRERGFSSAHQFFKGVGGSKSLGLSFVSYWDIERGKKLPKSRRLKFIISALGVGPHSSEAKELVRAYFRTLTGSDELLEIVAPTESPTGGTDLAETAAHMAISRLSVNLTMEQWRVRSRDLLTNFCQSCLSETEGWMSVRELSEGAGFKPEAVRTALKALAACGLADFEKDKARGRLSGKVVQMLPFTPATAPIRVAIRGYWDKWLEGSQCVSLKRQIVRLSKSSFGQYQPHLEKAVNLAAVYGNPGENRHNSALYFVDAGIYKIFPKK